MVVYYIAPCARVKLCIDLDNVPWVNDHLCPELSQLGGEEGRGWMREGEGVKGKEGWIVRGGKGDRDLL